MSNPKLNGSEGRQTTLGQARIGGLLERHCRTVLLMVWIMRLQGLFHCSNPVQSRMRESLCISAGSWLGMCVFSPISFLTSSYLIHTYTHNYNMFTRTKSLAIAAPTLGALGVVAQTAAETAYREKVRACAASVGPVDFQEVYSWEYDDPTYYNITYSYDPTYCDSTMTVNYIQLQDYANGGTSPCTRQQFAANRNTIFAECRVFDR